MMRAFMLTEPEDDELDYPEDSENIERTSERTTSINSNRSRASEPYKYDLQERLKETLERMRSTSFDNTMNLPSTIPNVVLSEVLQCCFKKKKGFFRRTGKIMKLQVCLTNKDTLIIYKTSEKGLVLSLNSVRKTSVTTQTVTMNSGRIMLVCRYRIVFDFGTLNLFLINDAIHRWRIALDEVIDKYARLYYELPEESCTETEKQSYASSECQETQESATCNDSIVCTGTPSKLTLDTEPSRRSFKSSPYTMTSSSSRDVTVKEPAHSIRCGKRSVASLRARIQRKICGCSTFRSLKQKPCGESSKACQVSEKELLLLSPLVPAMRKRRSTDMSVEPLLTISETSASSAPPLPSNPPPSLSCSNQGLISEQVLEGTPSPYKNVSIRTALSSSSYQKLNNSDFLEMLCTTPSVSSENPEDVQTAISGRSTASKSGFKAKRVSVSVEVKSQVVQSIQGDSEAGQEENFEHSATLKKLPKSLLEPAIEPPLSSTYVPQPAKVIVTSATIEEIPRAPPSLPAILQLARNKQQASANLVNSTIPNRPPRHREGVHFSISPYHSGDEDNSHDEAKGDDQTPLPNKAEDLPPDVTQHSDHPEAADPLRAGKQDTEWWQHSHMA